VPVSRKVFTIEEEEMSKKDKPLVERIRSANDVLNRAFEGGFFDAWKENCWSRASRDTCRAAAREMLGDGLSTDLKVRLDVRARDVYRDQATMPTGDWDKAKDAKLVKVFVVGPSGETGE
jgi:hypothetical protein